MTGTLLVFPKKEAYDFMEEYKLRVEGIEKSFPGVKALSNISFAVRKGDGTCPLRRERSREIYPDEGADRSV